MVGAVLVRDGVIVGEGYHATYGGDHAEVHALHQAGPLARGATAYVTLEPCAHIGQTPPCVDALIAAGVSRVVFATRDPNPLARGGLERLVAAGIETEVGVEQEAARELNASFFHSFNSDRPWITLKLAVSLDGAVADRFGTPGRLTGEAAHQEVHRMRAGADAVAVGIGTVLADDPLLTVRYAESPRTAPARVVFDRHARLPLESRLVRSIADARVLVVATTPEPARARALSAAGVSVLVTSSIEDAMHQLRVRGIRSLLVEGGPELAGACLTSALVDRLVIFQAPVILGAGAKPAFGSAPAATVATGRRLVVVDRRSVGGDLMTVFALSNL
jgi:diaminohydroxyphosphoribosylaminopyrimidine deaminase / 5-amino-6-(5-phosphoribosylamino)uracil reductase